MRTAIYTMQKIRRQSEEFVSSLPDGFYDTISNIVKPMTPKTNKKKVHGNVVDTGHIYCRAMVLLQTNSDRSEELSRENILSYELCGVPLSLFHEDGSTRVPKNKSQLKNISKEEVPARGVEPRVVILDGSAILWTIPWPAKGALVKDFLLNIKFYLLDLLRNSDVYLIFDRYFEDSIKYHTRCERPNGVTRRYT